jgi:hypothetical protein
MNHPLIDTLQSQRSSILAQIAALGDFRPGKLYHRHKRCGSKNCHCNSPDSQGHGPYWRLSRKKRGQISVSHSIPEDAVEMTRRHVERFDRFDHLVNELVEVSDQLCQARIKAGRGQKKTSSAVRRKSR